MAARKPVDPTPEVEAPAEKPAPKKAKDQSLGESASAWAARVSALADEIASTVADERTAVTADVMTHAPANDEYDVAGLVRRVDSTLADVETALAPLRSTVAQLVARVG